MYYMILGKASQRFGCGIETQRQGYGRKQQKFCIGGVVISVFLLQQELCGYQQNGLSQPIYPMMAASRDLTHFRNKLALQPCVEELQELIGEPLTWNWDYPEDGINYILDKCERKCWVSDSPFEPCLKCKGKSCTGKALLLFFCGGCDRTVIGSQWGMTLLLCSTCLWNRQFETWQQAARQLTETGSLREAWLRFENRES